MNKKDTLKLAASKALARFRPSQPAVPGRAYPVNGTLRLSGTLSVGQPSSRKPSWDAWELLTLAGDKYPDLLEVLSQALQEAPAGQAPEEVKLFKATAKACLPAPDRASTPIAPRVTFAGTVEVLSLDPQPHPEKEPKEVTR